MELRLTAAEISEKIFLQVKVINKIRIVFNGFQTQFMLFNLTIGCNYRLLNFLL